MRVSIQKETSGGFWRSMIVKEVDEETLFRAKGIFEDYKKKGVILNHSFDDHEWKLTNQVHNVGFTLITFEGTFRKSTMGWLGCTHRCFQDCIKAYMIFNLGQMGLSSLQEIIKELNKISGMTSEVVAESNKYLNHMVGLLQIIPGESEERDYVIASLEERIEQTKGKQCINEQRQLADFKSYLRFHDILTTFWQTADENQKLFYFPLYLWWNLTAILPLRPTEFLLIPRNCLRFHNEENFLTIRRTKLKKDTGRVGYSIIADYELKEYAINDKLAYEIYSYLEATVDMPETKIDTLFLQTPHINYIRKSVQRTSRYYTYAYMSTCLRYFYKEVINENGEDISPLTLGDTRHIAMTNLIISGGSPVICRELAGHSDINASSHYYSNISNLVECMTIEKLRKTKGPDTNLEGTARYPLFVPEDLYRVDGGYCDAPSVKEGKIDECLKSFGKHGYIGECAFCTHYWPDKHGIRLAFYDEKIGKEQVDADCRYLIRMIELVRKGIGYTEDIGTALLRLQQSSYHYGRCLWEKYKEVDKPEWQDQEN